MVLVHTDTVDMAEHICLVNKVLTDGIYICALFPHTDIILMEQSLAGFVFLVLQSSVVNRFTPGLLCCPWCCHNKLGPVEI